jgi:hypothetical protein
MYIVVVSYVDQYHPAAFGAGDGVMTTIDPQGNITYDCMPDSGAVYEGGQNLIILNEKFNTIISQGYKLVSTDSNNSLWAYGSISGAWYFAIL